MSTPLYRDSNASVEERVEDLLALMTLDEKLAQLSCLWSTAFVSTGTFDPNTVAEKMPHSIGQVTRIGASTGLHPQESAAFMNAIQQVAVERTRLGIPVIVHEESTGGFCHRDATVFPQGIGLAATWNPVLVKKVADVIRTQMMAVGARHALAPVLDVARDPRWGRVEETYGEDPVLTGTIGTAYVQGLQSDDLHDGVAATGKHFLGYAMSEGGRNWGPVHLGPRELREVYAEPFAAVIRNAGLATIMNSYASVDGLPCAGSPAILTELLRDELGFSGAVVADYASVLMLMDHHHVAAHRGDAARLALLAGLDMELPEVDCYGEPLKAEVEAGRVPLEVVDTAVQRVLYLKFQLGLFEHPYVDAAAANVAFQTPEQRALARQAVAESTILLTNDGVLPLAPTVKRVAVIGPGADDERLLQGDYHYPAHLEIVYAAPANIEVEGLDVPQAAGSYAPGPYFTPHITPLAGLRAACGKDVEVRFAKGCEVLGDDRSDFAEAVQEARNAEVAVVVVAGRSGISRPVTVGEGNDATNLDLTGVQQELVEALSETGTPLVVVVLSGRVHTLTSIARKANALLQLFPPGEEGGNGLADVLTGKVNPCGRLPVSLPRSVGQVPNHVGPRAGGDRAMFFGDYIDSPTSPLFAFGHGLSYTTFAYRDLTVQAKNTTEYSTALKRVGIESGPCIVLYLERTDFPIPQEVNMRGRHAALMIQMSQQTRVTLRGWLQRQKTPLGRAKRARAMLLLEQGYSYTHTAKWVGLTERNLRKWAKRFHSRGVAGLDEKSRPGRTPVFSPEVALYIVKLACERPDDRGRSLSQWDCPDLARKLKADGIVQTISPETVGRILRSHKLKPWRSHLWLSPKVPRDQQFAEQVKFLVELYTRPLAQWERVLCVDEKTNLQPRPPLAPTKPTRPGLPTRMEHEYKRAGALHLFAAFDTRTGKVSARTTRRKRQAEFITLLAGLDREIEASVRRIFLVLDNASIHRGKQVQAWLAAHPRFVCHFLPMHCSWMNQVEQWFSILQRKRLRISDFASLDHLAERLMAYVSQWNAQAHPFNWSTKSAAKVMAKCEAQTARLPAA